MKTKIIFLFFILISLAFFSCSDAEVASSNLSRASDQFEVYRRVVFYNSITDVYILSIEGYCSIKKDNVDNQLELTVKTGSETFMKHYLGISDNVTYFVEQIENKQVGTDKYRVIFKPSIIKPYIDIK